MSYIKDLFSLKNKVAVVTGAASGNGKAIAEGLLKAGAYVLLVDNNVDLTDGTLLAAAFTGLAGGEFMGAKTIIFDNEIFNQDIFLTSIDNGGSTQDANYYLELDQIKLDLGEATVATLKDMRGSN